MANHGFIFLKTKIDGERLGRELRAVNEARFKGKLKIERAGEWDKGKPLFTIKFVNEFHILFWLAHPRKIEHRHGPGGDLRWWIEDVLANDVAVSLKGKMGDEGVDGKWEPKPGKWPTLRAMLDERWANMRRLDRCKTEERKNVRLLDSYFVNMELEHAKEARPDLAEFFGEPYPPIKKQVAMRLLKAFGLA